MDRFLNKSLCNFRKAHSAQHALFRLLQKWQNELDRSGMIGTALIDLSKAYDWLPHDSIVAKFETYGLNKTSLSLFLDYLTCRQERMNPFVPNLPCIYPLKTSENYQGKERVHWEKMG